MPTASTNAYRHAAEIGGHEGVMPWGSVSQESNQPAARKLTCTDMGESGYIDTHVIYSPHSHTLVLSTT